MPSKKQKSAKKPIGHSWDEKVRQLQNRGPMVLREMLNSLNQVAKDQDEPSNPRSKPAQPMNSGWKELGRNHLKEFLPSLYADLVAAGELENHLDEAVRRTKYEMGIMMDKGYYRHEAWDVVSPEYLILEPETDNDEDYGDNPNKPFLEIMDEIYELRQRIYDEF